MVEVFKTNITDKMTALNLTTDLYRQFPGGKINFDLDDCDRILRVESDMIVPEEITEYLTGRGYYCEILD